MQVEFNANSCRKNISELQKIEIKLKRMTEQLMKVYAYYRISNDIVEREIAKKIHQEIVHLEREARNVSVMRKSLEKITGIYDKNESTLVLTAGFVSQRFVRKFEPPWKLPVVLKGHKHNGIDIVLYKEIK